MPLTFISGFFGMNFVEQLDFSSWWVFGAALLVMAASVVTMLVYFRRRRWI